MSSRNIFWIWTPLQWNVYQQLQYIVDDPIDAMECTSYGAPYTTTMDDYARQEHIAGMIVSVEHMGTHIRIHPITVH